MNAETMIDALWEERAVAILRARDHSLCRDAMSAVVEGGFRVVEFTLSCPEPFDLIEEFAKRTKAPAPHLAEFHQGLFSKLRDRFRNG